ncbi:androglobin isoform X2 [Rhinoderma darwinii]|uniref:androglobin isoform X2 n=1 Tax=Rhinoderma darwinii TaxID=43563 RepID=UPI003F6816AF
MSSRQAKKKESGHRLNSAMGQTPREMASVVANTLAASVEFKKGRSLMWPEWNESDINAEKWDTGKAGKEKDKTGKSPALHFFDDPEGKIELPNNLKIHSWKRPHEFITSTSPVVVKDETSCDLLSENEHLIGSELMRWIISEVSAVWRIYNENLTENKTTSTEPPVLAWKPWEHIYALCKAVKGHIPLYNSYGKYIVKLYWMGCWRKIVVDDTLPFSEDDKLLLPATTCEAELWPMLLSKAIIKLASVDTNGFAKRELGEFTVLHALTGWLPEVIPLQNDCLGEVWELLKRIVPEFKLPIDDKFESKPTGAEEKSRDNKLSDDKPENPVPIIIKPSEKGSKEKADSKDTGKKKGDKEKTRSATHSARPPSELSNPLQQCLQDFTSVPLVPQTVVYASYLPLHLSEQKISILGQMADSSEKLRQYGLSHIHNHPVLVSRTRSCPLVAPLKSPPVPRWKLIRQKKEVNVTDEAKEPVEKKADQFVEITTPFLNFRLNPLSLPSEGSTTTRRSSPMTSSLASVVEAEEMAQESSTYINENVGLNAGNGTQVNSSLHENITDVSNDNEAGDGHTTDGSGQAPNLIEKEAVVEIQQVTKQTWMEFSDFGRCFQTLYIFHKPNTYAYTYQKADFKTTDDRDRGTYFLCVDNLRPTEILLSFSALTRWGDILVKQDAGSQKGILTAEHFSWKSILNGPVILKLHTYVTKAAMISLPPGRHVLRFTASSPLGHHIHLCSTVPFVFGDEETVMPYLDKESYRFMDQATYLLRAVLKVMHNFSNENELPRAFEDLELAHYPQQIRAKHLGFSEQHFKTFHTALWRLMTEAMGNKVTHDLVFAFRVFTMDFSAILTPESNFMQDLKSEIPPSWQNRITTCVEEAASSRLQAWWRGLFYRKCLNGRKPGTKENMIVKGILDKICAIVEPNVEQYGVHLLRYMFKHSAASHEYPCYADERYRIAFADYAVTYPDQPANSWFVVFREVFHVPEKMLIVPKMYTNLQACALHVINNDTLEEIPWVCNKVAPFLYTKNMKGYTFIAEAHAGEFSVASGKWRLRLIGACNPLPSLSRDTVNNAFSMKEIRDYYIPNKKEIIFRYTVKAAIDHMATVQVQTSKSDVFIKIQILDNDEEVVSVTGKGQALIPAFCFMPNERPLSSHSSKSQVLVSGTKKGRISSGGSQKNNKTSSRPGSIAETQHSGESETTEEKMPSPQPTHKYIVQATVLFRSWALTDSQAAFVQTLKDMEKQEMKVYAEKNEEITAETHISETHLKSAGTPKTARKGKEKIAEKSDKEKSGKDRERLQSTPTSRPESQAQLQFDPNKPSWIVRFVSETSESDTLEVKKDTERIDEIRALKQAWELAEPGRAVKALQSRLQFVNKYMQKTSAEQTENIPEGDQGSARENVLSTSKIQEPQSSKQQVPTPKGELEPLDLAPFIRSIQSEPVLRDEQIIQQQALQKAEEIRQFRQLKEEILKQRQLGQSARNFQKQKVLQMYDDLQILLDKAREQILITQEAYRKKRLEAEKRKQEDHAAQEATVHLEEEMKTPSAQKRKSAKSGKKK